MFPLMTLIGLGVVMLLTNKGENKYETIALATAYDAEEAYSKYYDELEKSKG